MSGELTYSPTEEVSAAGVRPETAGVGSPAERHTGTPPAERSRFRTLLRGQVSRVNSELRVLLVLFGLAGLLNVAAGAHAAVLSLYSLPTIFSAYVYGRRSIAG